MSTENVKKAIQLSDSELDEVSGGSYRLRIGCHEYFCSAGVSNFDTLYYIDSPNGCTKFISANYDPFDWYHCCSHCDKCKPVTGGGCMPPPSGPVMA